MLAKEQMGGTDERFGSCDRCQKHDRLTFTRDGESNQYKWICRGCQVVSSGRWSAASLQEVDRQQIETFRQEHQERRSSGKIALNDAIPARGLVLVVEDDASIREAICNILEDEGIPTARASNGREALALLRQLNPLPGMILLDLMMPVMNGFEFYERISSDRAFSSVPVVVMTAQDSVQMGSLTLLQKPLHLETLLAAVSAICCS